MKFFKNLIQCVLNFFQCIFNISRKKPVSAELVAESPRIILVESDSNQPASVRVAVYDSESGAPVADRTVRFRVIRGAMRLSGGNGKMAEIRTDHEGRAVARLTPGGPGQSSVRVDLLEANIAPLRFVLRSEGVAHSIHIISPETYDLNEGLIQVQAAVLDHRDLPVVGADLVVEGHYATDSYAKGEAREIGGGVYEINLSTRRAGAWTLSIKDRTTRTIVRHPLMLEPGEATAVVQVGESDPRLEAPYHQTTLRLRLEDKYGNAHFPSRLQANIDGHPVDTSTAGEELHIPLERTGSGTVEVEVEDRPNGLKESFAVKFAGFWFENPGVVEPGTQFQTELYGLPEPGSPLNEASVQVTFDAERASFVRLEPPENASLQISDPDIDTGRLAFTATSKAALLPEEYPHGIHLGTVIWDCTAAGETCFSIEGSMSPDVDVWTLCPSQKREAENIKCICVNVIYRQWIAADRRLGYAMACQAVSVISSNWYECCPILFWERHICPISQDQWDDLVDELDWFIDEIPQDIDDLEGLFSNGICSRDDCIDLYVLPIGDPSLLGYTDRDTRAKMVVDPADFQRAQNLAAHEFGHALGLDHTSDRWNLMYGGTDSENPNVGRWISRTQCREIVDNLGNFPCGSGIRRGC